MHDDRVFPFEKVARLESPERRQRQPPEPLVELVAAKEPGTVLDVGVGTGYFAVPIAQRLPNARVIGIDLEPRMLEVFRKRAEDAGVGGRVEAVQVPKDSITLGDSQVELTLMVNIHHELPDRTRYLQEVHRVLSPGGTVVICDWDPAGTPEFGPPLEHRIAREAVEKELADAGFAAIRSHNLYQHYYVIEASKS